MKNRSFQSALKTLQTCFSSPHSWLVMGVAATSIFIVSVLLQNWLFIYKGILGTIMGILGIGCLACNASILGTTLASVGGIGLITLLPLRGRDFLLSGSLLGSYSLFSLAKPDEMRTCPIRIPSNEN